jgi:hypothetical protein
VKGEGEMIANLLPSLFTIEIGDTPALAFEAQNFREERPRSRRPAFRQELTGIAAAEVGRAWNFVSCLTLPRMPRYFFNVSHDGDEPDFVGEELPDMHAAWKEATVTAGKTIQNIDGKLKPGHDWRLQVTDEFANTLYELHVSARKPTRP